MDGEKSTRKYGQRRVRTVWTLRSCHGHVHVTSRPKTRNREKLVSDFPKLSIRKAASAVGVSATLVYHILHDDLHLKPYKFHQWHKLEEGDYNKRLNFAKWSLNLPNPALNHIIFSDEAYFFLTLPSNNQNNRQWSESNPCLGVETPLHDEKILVWCGISVNRVFGPYYFESTVNQHNYLEMLQKYFWPKILRTADYKKYYFQQDGAHCKNGSNMVESQIWPKIHQ